MVDVTPLSPTEAPLVQIQEQMGGGDYAEEHHQQEQPQHNSRGGGGKKRLQERIVGVEVGDKAEVRGDASGQVFVAARRTNKRVRLGGDDGSSAAGIGGVDGSSAAAGGSAAAAGGGGSSSSSSSSSGGGVVAATNGASSTTVAAGDGVHVSVSHTDEQTMRGPAEFIFTQTRQPIYTHDDFFEGLVAIDLSQKPIVGVLRQGVEALGHQWVPLSNFLDGNMTSHEMASLAERGGGDSSSSNGSSSSGSGGGGGRRLPDACFCGIVAITKGFRRVYSNGSRSLLKFDSGALQRRGTSLLTSAASGMTPERPVSGYLNSSSDGYRFSASVGVGVPPLTPPPPPPGATCGESASTNSDTTHTRTAMQQSSAKAAVAAAAAAASESTLYTAFLNRTKVPVSPVSPSSPSPPSSLAAPAPAKMIGAASPLAPYTAPSYTTWSSPPFPHQPPAAASSQSSSPSSSSSSPRPSSPSPSLPPFSPQADALVKEEMYLANTSNNNTTADAGTIDQRREAVFAQLRQNDAFKHYPELLYPVPTKPKLGTMHSFVVAVKKVLRAAFVVGLRNSNKPISKAELLECLQLTVSTYGSWAAVISTLESGTFQDQYEGAIDWEARVTQEAMASYVQRGDRAEKTDAYVQVIDQDDETKKRLVHPWEIFHWKKKDTKKG